MCELAWWSLTGCTHKGGQEVNYGSWLLLPMYMSVLLKFQVFQALSVCKKATLHKILIFNDRHLITVDCAVKPGDKGPCYSGC